MANKKMVLIMGETGSGKSSFLNSAIGEDPENLKPAPVGAESFSCTKDVEEFLYRRKDGLTISLVDSPGFNNFEEGSNSKSDAEILQMMIDFLKPKDGEPDHEPRVFSGVVFLHSINSLAPTEFSRKTMRQLKSLCGNNQLNSSLVVVTTRWDVDECQSDDSGAQSSGEDMLELLLDSNKFLKELHGAGVSFVRTCYFNDQVPQLPGDSEQYQSPRAIVEQLLGLEPDSDVDHGVDVETIQEPRTRVLVLADEPEPPKEDLNGCTEQKWDALEDSQSVTTYAESEQTETTEDLEPPKLDLNGWMEQSCNTPEDLQSVTNYAESEQTDSEMNEDPKRRCINEREWPFLEFRDQWKAWEDRQMSLLVTQYKSFAESQAQVLKSMHSEILKGQERLGSQVVELKQALKPNQKQHDEPDIIKMETNSVNDVSGLRAQLGEMKSERDRVEASKLETERELESTREVLKEAKEELEARGEEVARLREQVQAQANETKARGQQMTLLQAELEEEKERARRPASLQLMSTAEKMKSVEQGRELADLRKQLQDGTRRIASLETELEKGKRRLEEQAQGSKSEQHVQRTASLEIELKESKLRLEEKERELAKQAKEKERHLLQVASLEMALKESKKMLEAQVQESESTRPRNEAQDKTPSRRPSASRMASLEYQLAPVKRQVERIEGRVHAQRATPLDTDSRVWKQTQESDFPQAEVQGLVSQCESLKKTLASLEQELRSYQNVPSRARTLTLARQFQPPPIHPSSGRGSVHRTGAPLIPQRTASPANQSIRSPAFNAS